MDGNRCGKLMGLYRRLVTLKLRTDGHFIILAIRDGIQTLMTAGKWLAQWNSLDQGCTGFQSEILRRLLYTAFQNVAQVYVGDMRVIQSITY